MGVIPKCTVEPYWLWKTTPFVSTELARAGDLDRYTGGVRIWGKDLGRWDYNLAIVRQWGDVAGNNISAWGSYAEVGYTLPLHGRRALMWSTPSARVTPTRMTAASAGLTISTRRPTYGMATTTLWGGET